MKDTGRKGKALRCRLGLHKWLQLGYLCPVAPMAHLWECLVCHRREARYGYATMFSEAPVDGWTDYLEIPQKMERGA